MSYFRQRRCVGVPQVRGVAGRQLAKAPRGLYVGRCDVAR